MTSRTLGAAEQPHDAVRAEGDVAVRRGPYANASRRKPILLRLGLVEAHHAEHPLLDVVAVDTDRPATDLVAVADDVVGPGRGPRGSLLEAVGVLLGLVNAWCTAVEHRPRPDVTGGRRPRRRARQGASTTQGKLQALSSSAAAPADLEAGRPEQGSHGFAAPAPKTRSRRARRPRGPSARRAPPPTGSWPPGRRLASSL